jgi:hypothetical protein
VSLQEIFARVMCGGGFRELSKAKTTVAPIVCDLCESTAVGAESLQLLCAQFMCAPTKRTRPRSRMHARVRRTHAPKHARTHPRTVACVDVLARVRRAGAAG